MAELDAEITADSAVAPPINIPGPAIAAAGAGGGSLNFPAVPTVPIPKITTPTNVKKVSSFERQLAELETA
jgi:hypothetical protein